jgi:hypothetical protein
LIDRGVGEDLLNYNFFLGNYRPAIRLNIAPRAEPYMARLGRGIPTNASSRAGPFGEPPPSYSSVVVDPLPGKTNYSFEGCCSDTIL